MACGSAGTSATAATATDAAAPRASRRTRRSIGVKKRMSPLSIHVAAPPSNSSDTSSFERLLGDSGGARTARTWVEPSATETAESWPSWKKPMRLLSGDQNGDSGLPSVTSWRGAPSLSGRTHNARRASGPTAVNAM